MQEKLLEELTDQDLLSRRKKIKSAYLVNAVIIVLFIGVSIYITFKKGIGFFTFFPLFFAYTLVRSSMSYKAIEKEIKSRNLN